MKKKFSLRFALIVILIVFVVSILGLIYLFQTTFLYDFYRQSKVKDLQTVSEKVLDKIDDLDNKISIDEISMSDEVCVRVVSNNPDYNYVGACSLRLLDNDTVNQIASLTKASDNEKLFDNFKYQRNKDVRFDNIYIYSKLVNINNEMVMILVSSIITPLNSTIATIKSQYFYIALIVFVMAIVLALIISRVILRPIKRISEESKKLSKGEYDEGNVKTGLLEVSELNLTLSNANEDIIKAEKAKKELLGNVSHDLRTPLTMIVGYGEMIRDIKEENNEDNINVIIDEAKRLSDLVNDLIDISRIDQNGIELNKTNISINELLLDVYHQYEKYCSSQNVDFKLEIGEDKRVLLDEKRIKQVLYNFINNALNYNHNPNAKIVLGSEIVDSKVRVYVYDNGEGIDQKDIDKVWDRYYKVDKSHIRHHIGSGIGLSLSKELLKAHGLDYGVESKINEYSKFYFDIAS